VPGVHIYAVDARFHGGSDRHGEVDWLQMAGDMEALLGSSTRKVIGVGTLAATSPPGSGRAGRAFPATGVDRSGDIAQATLPAARGIR
jgi:hypothetical protein